MEKGFGWWYPAGADGPDAPWNQEDHHPGCRLHEDNPATCKECDGQLERFKDDKPTTVYCECAEPVENDECQCEDIENDAADSAADAAWERRMDREEIESIRDEGED